MSYLRSPITITFKPGPRSKKKLVKVLRGITANNIDRIYRGVSIPGIPSKAEILHIGIGYRYIPDDKLTKSDQKMMDR